jgi:hypothetical protein
MSAVLITGCSAAGKPAIAAVLARRGLACIDDDEDPFLARFVDSAGAVVAEDPAELDFAWLSRHRWEWDPGRLDELIRAAAPATLYLCGGADNELELADRFAQVFWLEIDEPTMLARLDTRQNNEWGRAGTLASTYAASCRDIRTACAHSGDCHRCQAAPRPGGGRDTLPHAGSLRHEPGQQTRPSPQSREASHRHAP